jgi:GNAT superfamily N-acetyltransferase
MGNNNIRLATLEDLETVRKIAIEWQKEANGNDFGITMDMPYHLADLQALISNGDTDLLVLCSDNKIIGYMGIMLYRSPLGEQLVANERYYYVLPEHRGFGSLRLIKAAMEWAKVKGCTHIQFSVNKMASNMYDKTCRLYEKLGMKSFEMSFIKEL